MPIDCSLFFQSLSKRDRNFYQVPKYQSPYGRTIASSSLLLSGTVLPNSEWKLHPYSHRPESAMHLSIQFVRPAPLPVLLSTPVYYRSPCIPATDCLWPSTLLSLHLCLRYPGSPRRGIKSDFINLGSSPPSVLPPQER